MLAELIMGIYGFDEIAGPYGVTNQSERVTGPVHWWYVFSGHSFEVGTCTNDIKLITVRPCSTASEAYYYRSPGGRTIFQATLRAVWKRLTLPPYPGNDRPSNRQS